MNLVNNQCRYSRPHEGAFVQLQAAPTTNILKSSSLFVFVVIVLVLILSVMFFKQRR